MSEYSLNIPLSNDLSMSSTPACFLSNGEFATPEPDAFGSE